MEEIYHLVTYYRATRLNKVLSKIIEANIRIDKLQSESIQDE
jgi:hypothetical protein